MFSLCSHEVKAIFSKPASNCSIAARGQPELADFLAVIMNHGRAHVHDSRDTGFRASNLQQVVHSILARAVERATCVAPRCHAPSDLSFGAQTGLNPNWA
jgi:hypothetical protein